MRWYDLEHPDITEACRTGYPRHSWNDDYLYDEDWDGCSDWGEEYDRLFEEAREEARLSKWDEEDF